jgi:hypothetical protein
MQCLSCGAQMRLEQVAGDDSVPVAGFEHHTFRCSACGDVERRRVFNRQAGRTPAAAVATPVVLESAPPISPSGTSEDESAATPALAKRMLAKFNRAWHAVAGRKEAGATASDPSGPRASAPPGEPQLEPRSEPIQSTPIPSLPIASLPIASLAPASLAPALPHLIEPLTVPVGKPASILSRAESDFDECEALLRRAIEMVHGETRPSQITLSSAQITVSPAELESASLATTSAPAPVERRLTPVEQKPPVVVQKPPVVVQKPLVVEQKPPAVEQKPPTVVQIHHDPNRAKYVAMDTRSGLGVLRHEDSARLRAMCERMGWQVVDDAPSAGRRGGRKI